MQVKSDIEYEAYQDSVGKVMYMEYQLEKTYQDSIKQANKFKVRNVFKYPAKLISYPFKLIWRVCSMRKVQEYGSTGLWFASRFYDAKADAAVFGKGTMYHGTRDKWHAYKNLSLLCTIGSFTLRGLGMGQGNLDPKNEFRRFTFGEMPLSWLIWQNSYDLHRYDKICDYRPAYNEHRFMLPFFGADRYAQINKPEVLGAIDFGILMFGSYNLIAR